MPYADPDKRRQYKRDWYMRQDRTQESRERYRREKDKLLAVARAWRKANPQRQRDMDRLRWIRGKENLSESEVLEAAAIVRKYPNRRQVLSLR